jgi:hypothetical protein
MSKARHKLTGIRHAIHNQKKTFQESDSGGSGTEVIEIDPQFGGEGSIVDKDSYMVRNSVYSGDSDVFQSSQLKIGLSYTTVGTVVKSTRTVISLNLYYAGVVDWNPDTHISNATLQLTVKGIEGGGMLGDVYETYGCRVYRVIPNLYNSGGLHELDWNGPFDSLPWNQPGAEAIGVDITTPQTMFQMSKNVSEGDVVSIDITELVQDAITNRGNVLQMLFIKNDDDDAFDGGKNLTTYYSSNSPVNKPTITIDWVNP